MKKQIFTLIAIIIFGILAYVVHNKYHDHSKPKITHVTKKHEHGHKHNHHDAKIKHYEGEKPTSIRSALDILNNQSDVISQIIAKAMLDNNDIEEIHKSSYSLESAINYLKSLLNNLKFKT